MKTTLEIPNVIFKKAKVTASRRGVPLREFITEAIIDKLHERSRGVSSIPSWKKLFGKFKSASSRAETKKIQAVVDREFSKADPAEWK